MSFSGKIALNIMYFDIDDMFAKQNVDQDIVYVNFNRRMQIMLSPLLIGPYVVMSVLGLTMHAYFSSIPCESTDELLLTSFAVIHFS